jgi:uncharacterized protein (DUF305 family)
MTRSSILAAGVVLATALATAACAATAAPSTQPAVSATAEEYEELYLARLDSARMRFTEADVAFMTRMIHHHAQAIEMAEMVPDRTENPQLRTLAERIVNAQKDEIAIMRRWLERRGQPVPRVGAGDMHAAMGHEQHQEMQMPGMLTREELRRLERAEEVEFDRLFLASMIRHHQGAVTMVHELFATDGAAQDEAVFKFASDVQVDQGTEVARMEAMLEALP